MKFEVIRGASPAMMLRGGEFELSLVSLRWRAATGINVRSFGVAVGAIQSPMDSTDFFRFDVEHTANGIRIWIGTLGRLVGVLL